MITGGSHEPRAGPARPLLFGHREALVRFHVRKLLVRAAGPEDFDRCGGGVLAEAEGEGEVARGAVGGAAVDRLHLRAAGARDPHHGADAVAVALRSGETELQPVVAIAAVVAVEDRGTVVLADKNIEVAVAVEVAIGRS